MEYLIWSNIQQQDLEEICSWQRRMEEYGGKQDDVWMWRWLWDVGNVRNELIRGETGWNTFEEREAKAMVK